MKNKKETTIDTFVINKEKESHKEIMYAYTFSGEEDLKDELGYPMVDIKKVKDVFTDYKVFALKVVIGNSIKYFVKRGKFGKLFNPIGLYSEGTARKYNNHAGKPEWTLQQTNKKVFDFYINFLKTKNPAWIINADREV